LLKLLVKHNVYKGLQCVILLFKTTLIKQISDVDKGPAKLIADLLARPAGYVLLVGSVLAPADDSTC
jgi:hypothetical protein